MLFIIKYSNFNLFTNGDNYNKSFDKQVNIGC